MPVPIRTRLVRAAAAAAKVRGWERYPSSNPWCSENQREPAPSRSASSHISSVNAYKRAESRRQRGGLRRSNQRPTFTFHLLQLKHLSYLTTSGKTSAGRS